MSDKCRPRGLPSKFKFIKVEGEGGFGKVVKCIDLETLHFVAIKMPKRWSKYTKNEVGNFVDVHSFKTYCIVKGAVSALCKKKKKKQFLLLIVIK